MKYFLIQAILIADVGDEESTFWMQIFVFLLLVVSWWVYSLIKNRQNKFKGYEQNLTKETSTHHAKPRWRFQLPHKYIAVGKDIAQKYTTKTQDIRLNIPNLSQEPTLDFCRPDTAGQKKPANESATEKNNDLHSGMELLELDFLLSIVENTESNDQKDLTMQKLSFNELLRRKKLNQVNSEVLKIYAINRGNLYDKDIQCEATKELAERTTRKSKHNSLQPNLPLSL
jgi:hypothetical protein